MAYFVGLAFKRIAFIVHTKRLVDRRPRDNAVIDHNMLRIALSIELDERMAWGGCYVVEL
jgi:hypothetical protein